MLILKLVTGIVCNCNYRAWVAAVASANIWTQHCECNWNEHSLNLREHQCQQQSDCVKQTEDANAKRSLMENSEAVTDVCPQFTQIKESKGCRLVTTRSSLGSLKRAILEILSASDLNSQQGYHI